MQHSNDRQRLRQRHGQDPVNPAAVVAKCLAGLLILLGIVLVGLYAFDGEVGTQAAGGAAPTADVATQHPPSAAGGGHK